MPPLEHDLPDGLTDWIESLAGGEIVKLHRHVARREAWVVDASRSDGSTLEGISWSAASGPNSGESGYGLAVRVGI